MHPGRYDGLDRQERRHMQTRQAHDHADVRIRAAHDDDLQAITDIYNQAVIAGGSTADLVPRTLEQRRQWVDSHHPRDRYPVVVLEDAAGRVVAFGSLSKFHPREAYDGVVELSYYVDEHARHPYRNSPDFRVEHRIDRADEPFWVRTLRFPAPSVFRRYTVS